MATLLPYSIAVIKESAMQLVITAIAAITGLVFSIAIALLVEELIFGRVFRLFSRPSPNL